VKTLEERFVNLTQLRAKVRDLTGIYTTDLVSDARVDDAINEVYSEVLDFEEWPFLRATTYLRANPGDRHVGLGVDAKKVLDVRVEAELEASVPFAYDNRRARVLRERSELAADWLGDGSGTPTDWVWDGADTIRLYPTPHGAEALTVRYVQRVEILGDDEATPIFDTEFHAALAYGAASRLLVQENDDTNRPAAYLAQFGAYLNRMRSRYQHQDPKAFVMGGAGRTRRRRWLSQGS
jgi:hypothetical protein